MSFYKRLKGQQLKWILQATYLLCIGLLAVACIPIQTKTVKTIGFVNIAPVLDPVIEGFKDGLAELGYVEGEDVTYIYAGATKNINELGPATQKLLDAEVDLIVALSVVTAQAAKQVTAGTEVPVIFVPASDPIGSGIVDSLSRPGGNMTGITRPELGTQGIEWLVKVAPTVKRVYIPYNPEDQAPAISLAVIEAGAGELGLELVTQEARNDEEITAALETIPDDVDGIFLLPDNLVVSRIDDVAKAAIDHSLPLASQTGAEVEAGALVAYGFDFRAMGKQAARLADQIFLGADPAELPVETAEYFLTINLKTAEAIELDIPDTLLRQADHLVR